MDKHVQLKKRVGEFLKSQIGRQGKWVKTPSPAGFAAYIQANHADLFSALAPDDEQRVRACSKAFRAMMLKVARAAGTENLFHGRVILEKFDFEVAGHPSAVSVVIRITDGTTKSVTVGRFAEGTPPWLVQHSRFALDDFAVVLVNLCVRGRGNIVSSVRVAHNTGDRGPLHYPEDGSLELCLDRAPPRIDPPLDPPSPDSPGSPGIPQPPRKPPSTQPRQPLMMLWAMLRVCERAQGAPCYLDVDVKGLTVMREEWLRDPRDAAHKALTPFEMYRLADEERLKGNMGTFAALRRDTRRVAMGFVMDTCNAHSAVCAELLRMLASVSREEYSNVLRLSPSGASHTHTNPHIHTAPTAHTTQTPSTPQPAKRRRGRPPASKSTRPSKSGNPGPGQAGNPSKPTKQTSTRSRPTIVKVPPVLPSVGGVGVGCMV